MDELASKLEIREVFERWVVWRDAGDWDRFAEVWHGEAVGRLYAEGHAWLDG